MERNKKKNFCIVKETINKVKRQPTEWKEIFAKLYFQQGLISKIHKELYHSVTKSNKEPKEKHWQRPRRDTFLKKDASDHEMMLNITNRQGTANQNHSEISCTSDRIKKKDNCLQRCGKRNPCALLVGMSVSATIGKTVQRSPQFLKYYYHMLQESHFWAHIQRK